IPGETLLARRIFRPGSLFNLTSYSDATNTYAVIQRTSQPIGSPVSITSWVYDNSLVTITAAAHGFMAGQLVSISGLGVTAGSNPPNGVWEVSNVPTVNTFQYT